MSNKYVEHLNLYYGMRYYIENFCFGSCPLGTLKELQVETCRFSNKYFFAFVTFSKKHLRVKLYSIQYLNTRMLVTQQEKKYYILIKI